jgi:hypothetical protein
MAVLGLVTACGPREPPLVSPGTSTASAIGTGSPRAAADAAVKWEGFGDLGAYRAMGKPFISRGHFAGRWQAEVLANESAAGTYAKLSRSSHFSPGAVLVKKHSEKDSRAPGPIFVMAKHEPGFFAPGGDWEYLVADSDGWIEDRGPLPACARCHAEAVTDWVFGLPADARP